MNHALDYISKINLKHTSFSGYGHRRVLDDIIFYSNFKRYGILDSIIVDSESKFEHPALVKVDCLDAYYIICLYPINKKLSQFKHIMICQFSSGDTVVGYLEP